MFRNPGGKIKVTANILFWLGLAGTVILAAVSSEDVLMLAAIAIGGAVISYISSLTLYGIGDAIEDIASTRYIARVFYEKEKNQQAKTDNNTPFKAPTPTVRTETGSFNLSDYI